MTAAPGYVWPLEVWVEPLTGDEFVPIFAGSVYPTMISLNALAAFFAIQAGLPNPATLPTVLPAEPGVWWLDGRVLSVS